MSIKRKRLKNHSKIIKRVIYLSRDRERLLSLLSLRLLLLLRGLSLSLSREVLPAFLFCSKFSFKLNRPTSFSRSWPVVSTIVGIFVGKLLNNIEGAAVVYPFESPGISMTLLVRIAGVVLDAKKPDKLMTGG